MPFDAPNYTARCAHTTPADDTPYARRRTLITALRAELPRDFVWDYQITYADAQNMSSDTAHRHPGHCGSVGCAIGLGLHIGLFKNIFCEEVSLRLSLQLGDIHRIFWDPSSYDADWDDVTPAMVADALEATLPESER